MTIDAFVNWALGWVTGIMLLVLIISVVGYFYTKNNEPRKNFFKIIIKISAFILVMNLISYMIMSNLIIERF